MSNLRDNIGQAKHAEKLAARKKQMEDVRARQGKQAKAEPKGKAKG